MKSIITLTAEEIKKNMNNEAMARRELIDDLLVQRWETDENHYVCSEFIFKEIEDEDNKIPDYLCVYDEIYPLAVVEAKAVKKTLKTKTNVRKLKKYCAIKNIPFGYLTNGIQLIEFDLIRNNTSYMRLDDFPSSDVLWERYKKEQSEAREALGENSLVGLIDDADMKKLNLLPYQLILYPFEYIYPKDKRNKRLFMQMVLERFYAYQIEHNSFEIKTIVLVDNEDLTDVYDAFKDYASGDYLLENEFYVMRTRSNQYKPIIERFKNFKYPMVLVTDKNPFSNEPNVFAPLIINLKKKMTSNEYYKLFVANVSGADTVTVIDFTLLINKFGMPDLNLALETQIHQTNLEKEIV